MDLGFDTIGNATLIAYDGGPTLVTDPWVGGSPYFGSWSLSHEIPEEKDAAIGACPYIWFSHGHPDHLNAESLPRFRNRLILLPDHVGRRIRGELERGGFTIGSVTSYTGCSRPEPSTPSGRSCRRIRWSTSWPSAPFAR
jgi:L-ascorbate metabolism protein UlaG (beta-lactamase superfamily)